MLLMERILDDWLRGWKRKTRLYCVHVGHWWRACCWNLGDPGNRLLLFDRLYKNFLIPRIYKTQYWVRFPNLDYASRPIETLGMAHLCSWVCGPKSSFNVQCTQWKKEMSYPFHSGLLWVSHGERKSLSREERLYQHPAGCCLKGPEQASSDLILSSCITFFKESECHKFNV